MLWVVWASTQVIVAASSLAGDPLRCWGLGSRPLTLPHCSGTMGYHTFVSHGLNGSSSIAKGAIWFSGVVIVALIGACAAVVVPRWLQPAEEIKATLSKVSVDYMAYSTRRGFERPTVMCDVSPCGPDSVRNLREPLDKAFTGAREHRIGGALMSRKCVGVTVSVNITMTGLQGDTADVRWSLYIARRGVNVPRAWLRSRSVCLPRSEAIKDTGSGEFWVPLPRKKGPFFIRIEVYSGAGKRLDYADTRRFS